MSGAPDRGQQQSQPTWLLRARRPDSTEWLDTRVPAASLLQAEAILRRGGWVVEAQSGRVIDSPDAASNNPRPAPGSLRCTRCGYELNGLLVRNAVVECPECGFGQVMLAYRSERSTDAASQSRGVKDTSGRVFTLGCLTGAVLVILTVFMLLSIT